MSRRKARFQYAIQGGGGRSQQKYVKEAFDTNWVVPMGPNVNAFEKDLEVFVNKNKNLDRRVVCLSAGTAAVHLALIACGVQAGNEVCVQSFALTSSSSSLQALPSRNVEANAQAASL